MRTRLLSTLCFVGALLVHSLTAQTTRIQELLKNGETQQAAGRYDEAILEFTAAVAEAERTTNRELLGKALSSRGYIHYVRGASNDALADFRRCYDIAGERGDQRASANALESIAHVYADPRVGEHDRAIDYYSQVLRQYESLRDAEGVADTLFNLASTLEQKGDLSGALGHYHRALKAEELLGREAEVASVKRSIGVTLAKLGRPREALKLFDDALTYFTRAKMVDRAMMVRQSRGIAYRRLGDNEKAIADLLATRDYFAGQNNDRYLEKTEDELALAYAAAGSWPDAFRSRTAQTVVQRRLADKVRQENTARLRVEFDSERKEQENAALLRQSAAAASIRKLQTIILALGAAIIATLAYFALRLTRNAKRMHTVMKLLETTNRDLQDAQREIARLGDAGEALTDVRTWSQKTAKDLAAGLHADEIAVFLISDGDLVPLGPTSITPPSIGENGTIRAAAPPGQEGDTVIAVTGLTGRTFGALTVVGKRTAWTDSERQIIATFAHQLGGALELQQAQGDLAEARERNVAVRQQMAERGIALVQICPLCARCFDDTQPLCSADDAVLDATRVLPFRIGNRYRLVRLLGSGGMGDVYEAADERLHRSVAIKVIKSRHLDAEGRARFDREARAIARVDHPNVLSIFDSGEVEEGSAYIVTELLSGTDLHGVLSDYGRGSPAEVEVLLRQGAAALAALHAAALIHRDIKPANLFLVDSQRPFHVKVVDFGIVKAADVQTELTQTGAVIGTPAYMAPEQIGLGRADGKTDLYSFAAVAYEALVGIRVSGDASGIAAMLQVLSTRVPPPSRHQARLTAAVDEAFEAALSKDPESRPPDIRRWAEDLAAELERINDESPRWPQPIRRRVTPRRPRPGSTLDEPDTLADESLQGETTKHLTRDLAGPSVR